MITLYFTLVHSMHNVLNAKMRNTIKHAISSKQSSICMFIHLYSQSKHLCTRYCFYFKIKQQVHSSFVKSNFFSFACLSMLMQDGVQKQQRHCTSRVLDCNLSRIQIDYQKYLNCMTMLMPIECISKHTKSLLAPTQKEFSQISASTQLFLVNALYFSKKG